MFKWARAPAHPDAEHDSRKCETSHCEPGMSEKRKLPSFYGIDTHLQLLSLAHISSFNVHTVQFNMFVNFDHLVALLTYARVRNPVTHCTYTQL